MVGLCHVHYCRICATKYVFIAGFCFLGSLAVTEDDSGSNTDEEFCVQLDDDAGGLERDIPLSLSFGGSAGTYHFGSIIIILKPLLMCTVY